MRRTNEYNIIIKRENKMKHVQKIISNFEYNKLFYICGKLNITIYELMKKYLQSFIKQNIHLIDKKVLEKIENGYNIPYIKNKEK